MPRVSVIIPAYRSAATIAAALDSVEAQAFPDLEIIVVDDASADDTMAVVKAWSEQHCHVLIMALPRNGGPAAARNAGARQAQGEWLAFLDADDLWLPGKLAAQLACAAAHPEAVVICGGRTDIEAGGRRKEGDGPTSAGDVRTIPLEEFARHNPVVTSTVLIRRRAFEGVGGFDTAFRGPEDYDLWIRVAATGPVLLMPAVQACYRHRPGSLSLDDRRFLPQVLGVIGKAFGPAGALREFSQWHSAALATQYQQASWMAFCRGDRPAAIRHLCVAFSHTAFRRHRIHKPWLALLLRYLVGARPPEAS